MGTRRVFSRECTPEAMKRVTGRGVWVSQAAPDRALHGNVLHKQVKAHPSDPQQAFAGHGQMKPGAARQDRLRTHHFRSRDDLDQTLHRYVTLYNDHLPQQAPITQTPARRHPQNGTHHTPNSFFQRPANRTGRDTTRYPGNRLFALACFWSRRLDAAVGHRAVRGDWSFAGPESELDRSRDAFFFTASPAIICPGIGILRSRRKSGMTAR